jgi:hypothetical protein
LETKSLHKPAVRGIRIWKEEFWNHPGEPGRLGKNEKNRRKDAQKISFLFLPPSHKYLQKLKLPRNSLELNNKKEERGLAKNLFLSLPKLQKIRKFLGNVQKTENGQAEKIALIKMISEKQGKSRGLIQALAKKKRRGPEAPSFLTFNAWKL